MRLELVTAALLCQISVAHGEDVRSILLHNYSVVTKAMQTKSNKQIEDVLAPSFHAISKGGKTIGREDIIRQFSLEANSLSDLQWPRKITDLKVSHDSAVATVEGDLTAKTKGQQPKQFDLKATSKDTWKKTAGKWLLVSSQVLQSKMTLDGKPLKFGAE